MLSFHSSYKARSSEGWGSCMQSQNVLNVIEITQRLLHKEGVNKIGFGI